MFHFCFQPLSHISKVPLTSPVVAGSTEKDFVGAPATLAPTNTSSNVDAVHESGDYDVNTPFIIGIWVLSASIAKIGK